MKELLFNFASSKIVSDVPPSSPPGPSHQPPPPKTQLPHHAEQGTSNKDVFGGAMRLLSMNPQ